ncbi:Shwachman-Bodian-diamond syndrome protein [Cucurbitaria berberidis CBS 394.84]|uniref:Shwachman-Bodian-diamond syndrome protein n=1 Tax=Cucurbitaria berberidis CBS 394.84 TaxID=1168544 RepID=A0A9P4GE81_9PLEO|nr:Shwachman-Bodian-diamond syndrome protein [Cucurbitaria berberidis CBS 394.84]KAF1844353.1 Shwachman-Bodian-diamond syndrome protein [Cucurbitaria berberidis CBS 394.84]
MPVGIIQPSNQIKLTNVSLVRMKKGKKRFEVACYKNKVLEWRNKIEKDLSNVLQIENVVFLNVSKGQVAPKSDLEKAFPKKSVEEIIKDILENGELQVGEKERNAELERTKNEVIDIVAGKLVDPKTKRVYTSGMIEKALDQLSSQAAAQQGDKSDKTDKAEGAENGEDKAKAKELPKWTGIVTSKSSKSQALFAMKALIAHQPIPVARMQMKLRVTCPTSVLKQATKTAPKAQASGDDKATHGTIKDAILGFMEKIESQDTLGAEWEAVGLVEPGAFKGLNELIEGQTKGRGNVEVLEMAVGAED